MREHLFVFLSALILFSAHVSYAQIAKENSQVEHVERFDVVLDVQEDSTIHVQETIAYDFGPYDRHGIFRYMPTAIQGSKTNRKIRISNIEVHDERGQPYVFKRSSNWNKVEFKIGDPDVLINGLHTYVISYTVSNAIGYFDSFDEIYWNATGNEWEVPISDAHVRVMLPRAVASGDLRISCYEGTLGSTETCESVWQGGVSQVEFSSARGYGLREGMTVAVGFPKGLIREPTNLERIVEVIKDNAIVFLPFLTLLFLLIAWFKWGRDAKGRGTIVPQYDVPDKLTPLAVSAIYRERLKNSDISAEIIYLATEGYFSINYIEENKILSTKKDYELVKLRDESEAMGTDRLLMEHLFVETTALKSFLSGKFIPASKANSVRISKLKDVFVQYIAKIKKDVFDQVVSGGYYKTSPEVVSIFGIIGFVVFGFGVYTLGANVISGLSFIVSGVLVFFFGRLMPAKTEKGMATYDYILGLREYLQIAEKDWLKFHNAPEKKPEVFEKLLPFAMVLGVEKAWAKEFQDIYVPEPSWYHGSGGAFNSLLFMNLMNDFSSVSNKTMLASSSGGSGGGGSSGGGGGGGGGGSW